MFDSLCLFELIVSIKMLHKRHFHTYEHIIYDGKIDFDFYSIAHNRCYSITKKKNTSHRSISYGPFQRILWVSIRKKMNWFSLKNRNITTALLHCEPSQWLSSIAHQKTNAKFEGHINEWDLKPFSQNAENETNPLNFVSIAEETKKTSHKCAHAFKVFIHIQKYNRK